MSVIKVQEFQINLVVGVESKVISITPPTKTKSAIYIIRNKFTDDCYIGQSTDFKRRWKRHSNDLMHNSHHSYKMQEHWNTFVDQNSLESGGTCFVLPHELFSFDVLMYCFPNDLSFFERYFIQYFNPSYNNNKQEK